MLGLLIERCMNFIFANINRCGTEVNNLTISSSSTCDEKKSSTHILETCHPKQL